MPPTRNKNPGTADHEAAAAKKEARPATEVSSVGADRPRRTSRSSPQYRLARLRAPNGTRSKPTPTVSPKHTKKQAKSGPSPVKNKSEPSQPPAQVSRPRGRPPKKDSAAKAEKVSGDRHDGQKSSKRKRDPSPSPPPIVQARRKRGRPSKVASGTAPNVETAVSPSKEAPMPSSADENAQYWLMKAEPESRIVKGKDVAFSIDHLAAATEPEAWDGVRNYVARNNMQCMRKDDLAFFYHSNCDVPGIVGVMRIAEEHSVDESAFDPQHPYFDDKSNRDSPKWDCVKVEFVKKFENIITLNDLKSTPELAEMQVATKSYGRLSVQQVTPAQWRWVLGMANEPLDVGMIQNEKDGYEAETDGETNGDKQGETQSAEV